MALYGFALAYITRNTKGKITGRSIQRFESEEEFEEFLEYSKKNLPDYDRLEIYEVSLQEAFEPEGSPSHPKHLWCPYCGEWNRFLKFDDGYVKCEICLISTHDFYTRKFNRLGS